MKKFYITLPIYYANGIPHIGHAYTSLIGDVFARYKRLLGYKVKFSVGTDENSQKIVQKAEEQGKDIMDFLDDLAQQHKEARDALSISYTDFIRTTENRHKEYVQDILQKAHEKGDFYEHNYEGLYCIGCEGFKKQDDLVISDGKHGVPAGEKVCPDHPHQKPQNLTEKNWFFKLSTYQKFLEDFYQNNPHFVQPAHRFNEIKSFVQQGLEDFSISREGATFGIPLPFDENQITYVWYDALLNYNTLCQGQDEQFWPVDLQVMGKDIIRFHSIYYPAMLKSVGIAAPKQQLINGFLTLDGQKISKSLGNTIEPLKVVEEYDRDALVLYFLYSLKIGSDGDFSRQRFDELYNAMLIGGWGNLISRTTKLALKNNITKIHKEAITSRIETYVETTQSQHEYHNELLAIFTKEKVSNCIEKYLEKTDLQQLVKDRYGLVQGANKFLGDTQPWKKLKEENTKQEGLDDIAFVLYLIKNLTILSSGFLINSTDKVKSILGIKELNILQTTETMQEETIQKLFDLKDLEINLQPDNLYQRKNQA